MNHAQPNELTAVIPTHNRARFLLRLLAFAEEVRFPYPIRIIDSSGPVEAQTNLDTVSFFRDRLDVAYQHVTCGLLEKLCFGLQETRTPYVCLWADDDFQIAAGLSECVNFLKRNPEYKSCTAQFLSIGSSGAQTRAFLATHPRRDEELLSERILKWSEKFYSNFYSVYRKEALAANLEIAKEACTYERCRIIPEILLGQLSLLSGRQGALPIISLVYQMHPGNDSRLTPAIKDDEAFPKDYEQYRQRLSAAILQQSTLSREAAMELIDCSFRNVYRWTGGRGWLIKKLLENIRRSWRRLQNGFAKPKSEGNVLVTQRLDPSDPILGRGEVAAAIRWIQRSPDGIKETPKVINDSTTKFSIVWNHRTPC